MAEANTTPSRFVRQATILKEWVIPEYTQHERGRGWFVAAGVVVFILAIISLWTPNFVFDRPNFMFLVIVLLAGVTVVVRHRQIPPLLTVILYEDGLAVGESFYTFRELGSFWIVYEPPEVKNLYFHFQSAWRPRLPVPLENENPVEVREILLKYLPEDLARESEPTSDAISRVLKL